MFKVRPAGFTMIELLVVVSITVMLMMTVSVFFLTFIVGSNKAAFEQKIKHDGENAMEQVGTMLRNARSIKLCQVGMTSISFTGPDNLTTILTGDVTGKIASISAITDPTTTFFLTSNYSTLTDNTMHFDCYIGANSQIYVEVVFTLKKGLGATNDQNTISRNFKTGFNLRNNF